jgi:hypothetical protein
MSRRRQVFRRQLMAASLLKKKEEELFNQMDVEDLMTDIDVVLVEAASLVDADLLMGFSQGTRCLKRRR